MIYSCVNPLDNFKQVNSKSFLSIEAQLSNEAKAHEVILSMTSDKLGLVGPAQRPVSGAKVFVSDEKGNREEFKENIDTKGTYLSSPSFAGRIGGIYTLYIKTMEGKEYQSSPEIMRVSPEIKKVNSKFEKLAGLISTDSRRSGFNIYIDLDDFPATEDYYQWQWKHYEKAKTCQTCNEFVGKTPFGANYDFETGKCLNSIPAFFDELRKEINYRCEENCWNITYSTDIDILSDALFKNSKITGKQIARIPFDSTTAYYLQLEQRAISKNTFYFYQNLKNQAQTNGTLFDVPAETQFNANIKSLNNQTEKILGIFNVFSSFKKIVYIDRSVGVPANEKPILASEVNYFACPKEGAFECKSIAKCFESNARTRFKPEGWIDKK